METIKTYLENMFSSMPDTPEVRKAKAELYQMIEDKYQELKSEGKSENEAIGIVIAEFGNLNEIKEELGISNTNTYDDNQSKQDTKLVSLIQAKEYLNAVAKYGNYIAIGVMLCIFSPICLIFLGGLTEISDLQNNVAFNENVAGFLGLLILFILIIIAVAIFVYTGNQLEEYEYLKKNIFQLDTATETYIREERKNNRKDIPIK